MIACPHCESDVFRLSKNGLKIKASTTMLVLHKSGDVEINCPKCRKGIVIPLEIKHPLVLQKAPRLVLKRIG